MACGSSAASPLVHKLLPPICGNGMALTPASRLGPYGRLFVNSGYAPFFNRPGNALLVFSVDVT